jgi:hypothetical protein
MRISFIIFLLFSHHAALQAQELFVHTDPASNIPAHAITLMLQNKLMPRTVHANTAENRLKLQGRFGLSQNLQIGAGCTFSNMFSFFNNDQYNLRFESVNLQAKYRFLSNDEPQAHFRMAAFVNASFSNNELFYDEISFDGDQSGVQMGVVATKLMRRFALSASAAYGRVATPLPKYYLVDPFYYNTFNYTLSAGLLVLPLHYKNYDQTNLNIYCELLGANTLDGNFTGKKKFHVDLAPAVQLIFKSRLKVDLAHRYQISGDMHRMFTNSWLLRLEYYWLGALQK